MSGMNQSFVPMNSGIEKLLSHYGIDVHTSIVNDEECFRQRLPREMGGGEQPIYFAPLIKNNNINNQLEYLQNIKSLVALKLSPISINREITKTHDLRATMLFQSSNRAWEMKERINLNPTFIRPPDSDSERRQFQLAYMVEGSFPSYFAGKPIPEKPKDESPPESSENKGKTEDAGADKASQATQKIQSRGDVLELGKPGKIFVVASADMIKDNLLNKEGRGPNDIFIMNTLDYLNDQVAIAKMRSKQQRFTPLNDMGALPKTVVKTINIIGLPVVVILFGLAVWAKRTGRKKKIQREFKI